MTAHLIKLLEDALAEAHAGTLSAVAIVKVSNDGEVHRRWYGDSKDYNKLHMGTRHLLQGFQSLTGKI